MKTIFLVCQQWKDEKPSYLVISAFKTREQAVDQRDWHEQNKGPNARYSYIIDEVDLWD